MLEFTMLILKSTDPNKKDTHLYEYEQILPKSNYAPWNKDLDFWKTYLVAQGSTIVDKYRLYELWTLVEQVAKLDSGILLEVGVWRGGSGALIAKQAMRLGIKENVYLCDTFEGVVKASHKDPHYKGGEHGDASMEEVKALISGKLKLKNTTIIQGVFPDQCISEIPDGPIRFCHIDVDVYQSAKDTCDWVWPRLVKGGIICYDDYGFKGCEGVIKHVEEQIPLNDRLVFHNLNGHAIIIKR